MDQIHLSVIHSWLAYLMRWPVLLQLIAVFGPWLGVAAIRTYSPHQSLFRRHYRSISAALIIAVIALLTIAGVPTGLAIFLAYIYGLWILIDWASYWLAPRFDANLIAKIDTGILRPLLIITATFILISKVSNLNQLAVIPLGSWFGSILTVGQVVTVLLAVYGFIVGSLPASLLLSALLGKLLNLRPGSQRALSLIIRYVIVGVGLAWALDFTGFNRTAIVAIAGGLSVGLGFGIKEVFANFVSGIWLLLEGAVRPGEVLLIDDDACEIRQLGLRAALLWRDRDNTELLIPNQIFLTTTTTTFTGSDGMRRCEVQISAAYKHQPHQVMGLIVEAMVQVDEVLMRPAPVALVLDYGDSAVKYAVRFWIANPMQGTPVSSEVRLAIWTAFQSNGIQIPYPQLVLHRS